MYHASMETLTCRTPGHEDKPQHGKTGLCQACYRREKRHERGLRKPGPKPDPTKPYSRHGGRLTHHGKRSACINEHAFIEGSFKLSITGKRICLVCEQARTHCHRGHERTAGNTYRWNGIRYCRVCRAEDAVWSHRLYKYKLTYEDIIEILEDQDFSCLLCGVEFDLDARYAFAVDHSHDCCEGEYTCGECVRGILCCECNKRLHDDAMWHFKAIDYLGSYAARKQEET